MLRCKEQAAHQTTDVIVPPDLAYEHYCHDDLGSGLLTAGHFLGLYASQVDETRTSMTIIVTIRMNNQAYIAP